MAQEESLRKRLALYKRADIRLLLDYTANGHEKLYPAITTEGSTYPEINRLLKIPDSSPLLEDLAAHNLYLRVTVDVEVACPSCASRRTVHDSYACPFCKSPSLKRGTLLEHYKCGHVALMQDYDQTGNLVCPKCRGVLRLIGTDYNKIQDTFRCAKCDRSFGAPSIIHRCLQCKNKFSYENASLWPVYSYEFNDSYRNEVQSNCVVQLPLITFLKENGFNVESPGYLKGQSGIEQDFDIVASRDGKNYVFTIATSAEEVTQEAVATLFAKWFDVEAFKSFMIAVPRMNPEGLKMASMYHIEVIQGEDHKQIMERIPSTLLRDNGEEPIRTNPHLESKGHEHFELKSRLMEERQEPTSRLTGRTRTQSGTLDSLTSLPNGGEPSELAKGTGTSKEITVAALAEKPRTIQTIIEKAIGQGDRLETSQCKYCGRSLIDDGKFCDQCGHLVN